MATPGARRRATPGAFRRLLSSAVCALAFAAIPADDALANGLRFDFGFTTTRPGASTGVSVRIDYPDGDGGKPKPLLRGAIELPQGTRIDESVVPVCAASDDELRTRSTSACPPDTRIGAGEITVITGCGPPIEQFVAEIHAFHGPGQVIYAYTQPGTEAPVLFVARDVIDGRVLRSSITTPRRCPRRAWLARVMLTYADDGSTESAVSRAPCRRSQ